MTINSQAQKRWTFRALILSIILIPIAHVFGWIHSVVFVNELTLIDTVLAIGAWFAASSVEARQEEEDIPKDVVDRIVDKTDISKE